LSTRRALVEALTALGDAEAACEQRAALLLALWQSDAAESDLQSVIEEFAAGNGDCVRRASGILKVFADSPALASDFATRILQACPRFENSAPEFLTDLLALRPAV